MSSPAEKNIDPHSNMNAGRVRLHSSSQTFTMCLYRHRKVIAGLGTQDSEQSVDLQFQNVVHSIYIATKQRTVGNIFSC